jgi:hypothetical protein
MPLTEQEKLAIEQRERVVAYERFIDDRLSILKPEIKTALMAHMSVISQTAYKIGRLEEQEGKSSVDMDRYRRNAQGTPGDGTEDSCTCGHQYHRHFDWMDDYREGCKYCPCQKFSEPTRVGLYGGRDK